MSAVYQLLLRNESAAIPIPLTIPGLQFWFDSEVGTFQDSSFATPADSDGDVVGGWRDQSGNGYDVIQATTANKPFLKLIQTPNGNNSIFYDGTTKELANTSVDLVTQTFTFAFAFRFQAFINKTMCLVGPVPGGIEVTVVSDKVILRPAGGATIGESTNALSTGYHILIITYDGTNWAMRVDEAGDGSGSNAQTFTTGTSEFYIGSRNGAIQWRQRFVDNLFYNRVLTAAEISSLETFLNEKSGIF